MVRDCGYYSNVSRGKRKRLIIQRNKAGGKIVVVRQEAGEINFFRERADGILDRLTSWGVAYDLAKNSGNIYAIVNKDGSTQHLIALVR